MHAGLILEETYQMGSHFVISSLAEDAQEHIYLSKIMFNNITSKTKKRKEKKWYLLAKFHNSIQRREQSEHKRENLRSTYFKP